jgi:hypothetical protein
MADVKISGLPASSTPLAGTEVLPIVQGGQTRQVSVTNLTAGKNVQVSSLTYGTNGVVSAIKTGQTFGTFTVFTYDIDGTKTYGTYMVEVQMAAQQANVLPGRAVEARKYIFTLNRYNSTITTSAINSEADSSYSSSSVNYAMSMTPSLNVVSGTKVEFVIALASTGAIPFTIADTVAQTSVLGMFNFTVS